MTCIVCPLDFQNKWLVREGRLEERQVEEYQERLEAEERIAVQGLTHAAGHGCAKGPAGSRKQAAQMPVEHPESCAGHASGNSQS